MDEDDIKPPGDDEVDENDDKGFVLVYFLFVIINTNVSDQNVYFSPSCQPIVGNIFMEGATTQKI
jgi:hypothetical protein